MKCGLLLDVVIRQGTAIFKLFTGEDETLLVWWNTFLVLDFGLDIFDGVGSFYLKRDGFARECFNEDLHTTSKAQNKMQSRLFLNIVIRKSSTILKLFASKD